MKAEFLEDNDFMFETLLDFSCEIKLKLTHFKIVYTEFLSFKAPYFSLKSSMHAILHHLSLDASSILDHAFCITNYCMCKYY